jgi:hypothetical protein
MWRKKLCDWPIPHERSPVQYLIDSIICKLLNVNMEDEREG